jgi:hypothetical protein
MSGVLNGKTTFEELLGLEKVSTWWAVNTYLPMTRSVWRAQDYRRGSREGETDI